MAIGTERPGAAPVRLWAGLSGTANRFGEGLAAGQRAFERWRPWLRRLPVVRLVTGTLLRRILATNLIGLVLLLAGILYLSRYHAWLIDAKTDSLRLQGEIIAAAIAADARVKNGTLGLDTGKLPETVDALVPFRDDGFAALELSIRPEQVAPILRKLIQPADGTRARIYGRDGTLIIDSIMLPQLGRGARPQAQGKFKPKDFWTRLQSWLIDKQLPVYKEIGTAKGTAYPEVRMALTGTTTPMLLLSETSQQIVSMAVPIRRGKTVQGVLLLSTRPGEIDEVLAEERTIILAIAALALAVTVITSLLLARTVAGPMRRLSHAADLVSHDISARQGLPAYDGRTDEVGQMADAFRSMTAALSRRIEASEKFAADVAHELKNPLTAARSVAQSLAYAKTEDEREQLVQQIEQELRRLNRLITDVSNASRLDAELARQQMSQLNLVTTLSSVRDVFRDVLSDDSRQVVLFVEDAPFESAFMVNGNDGRLGQVLTNLVDNALSFSPDNGVVAISLRRRGRQVELLVDDDGPGIPAGQIETIFDRFYSDRPLTDQSRGKNSGLGLSISREIVQSHGGRIWAENRYTPGEPRAGPAGARFVVQLPAFGTTRESFPGGRRGS